MAGVTVWQMLLSLAGYAIRGRAGQQVYVVTSGWPEPVQTELDHRAIAVTGTHAPDLHRNHRDRFVLILAEPEPAAEGTAS